MKKTICVILAWCLCTTNIVIFASWGGSTTFNYDFSSTTFSGYTNGLPASPSVIQENGLKYNEYPILPNQVNSIGSKYGIFGKNQNDGVMNVAFNSMTGLVSNPYTNCTFTGKYNTNNTILPGQTIRFSIEVAANNISNSLSLMSYGTSSDNAQLAMAYQPMYPTVGQKEAMPNNPIFQKYNAWFYFGLFSVQGKKFDANRWYKYDVYINTCDSEYENKQTMAFYLNNTLISKGILDANSKTENIDLVKSITQIVLDVAPAYTKNSTTGLYDGAETCCYIDNLTMDIVDKQLPTDEVEFLVNDNLSDGSYSKGMLSVKAKGNPLISKPNTTFIMAKYNKENGLEDIAISNEQLMQGEICISDNIENEDGYIKLMLVENLNNLKPITEFKRLEPRSTILWELNEVFDTGVWSNFSAQPAADFTVKSGVYGNIYDDKSLVFNSSDTSGSFNVNNIQQPIAVNNGMHIVYSTAIADCGCDRVLKVNNTEFIKIASDKYIYAFGNKTDAIASVNRWLNLDIIIYPNEGIGTVFMDGSKIFEGTVTPFAMLEAVEFGFNNVVDNTFTAIDNVSAKIFSGNAPTVKNQDMPVFASFENLKENIQYDTLNLSYINFDPQSNVFSYAPVMGKFGKSSDDCSLWVSNTDTPFEISGFSGEYADIRRQGVDFASGINSISSYDSVHISFDFAQDYSNTKKSLVGEGYVDNAGGKSMLNIVDINPNGTVKFFNDICYINNELFKILNCQWYHFDIILNSFKNSGINSYSAYINGKPFFANRPFSVGGSISNKINGFSKLQFAYDISDIPNGDALLPDNSHASYLADGFYIDNIKYIINRATAPKITDFDVTINDAVFDFITDSNKFSVCNYGQNTVNYINSISGNFFKKADFVTSNGETLNNIDGVSNLYLRMLTAGNYYIYYSLLTGDNQYIKNTVNEPEMANPNTSDWYAYEFPNISMLKGSPLDTSRILDAPAGKHGFISAVGEDFVFDDSTKVKFWGCNVMGSPPTNAQAEKMADVIAAQGFNLVRFHQLAGRAPNVFGDNTSGKTLDAAQMERLCYFFKQLRDRGIYYFIDQGRNVYPDDNLTEIPSNVQLVSYFDESVKSIQIEYSKMLLTYADPYTGKRICDDPALMGIDLINECTLFTADLTTSAYYYSKINTLFNNWLKAKYNTREKLSAAWSTSLKATEDQINGTVKVLSPAERLYQHKQRNVDTIEFFSDIQKEYFSDMTTSLRNVGVKALITGCTAFGMLEPPAIYSNMETDFIDYHNYWTHPSGYNLDAGVKQNTYSSVKSMLLDPNMGIIGNLMNRKIYNKPTTITEWNSCAGNLHMSEGALLMAAYSKMQNWNPMMFAFSSSGFESFNQNTRIDDVFLSINHPIRLESTPAASIVNKNVSEAQNYNFSEEYTASNVFDYAAHGKWVDYYPVSNTPTVGFLGKIGIAMGVTSIGDDTTLPQRAETAKVSGVFTSDTNELVFDKNQKIFTVNTVGSQAATGFLGGKTVALDDITFRIDNEFATIYLNSITDKPISESRRLLLTAVGRAWNSGQVLTRDGGMVLKTGKSPILIEPITGEICIKTTQNIKVYALNSSGQQKAEISTVRTTDGYVKFDLTKTDMTMNYEIIY